MDNLKSASEFKRAIGLVRIEVETARSYGDVVAVQERFISDLEKWADYFVAAEGGADGVCKIDLLAVLKPFAELERDISVFVRADLSESVYRSLLSQFVGRLFVLLDSAGFYAEEG